MIGTPVTLASAYREVFHRDFVPALWDKTQEALHMNVAAAGRV